MHQPTFTPEEVCHRTGLGKQDKLVRQWLVGIPLADRTEFLRQLWLLNYRYALDLFQAAQLPANENRQLVRHWLRSGHHNAAQALIQRATPVLGEKTFWRIASEETLTSAMRDFLNYHGGNLLDEARLTSTAASVDSSSQP
ncbi:hypothetical protein [Pseudomonas sp. PDM22]|uniref:hypothetical protein n=1 Tax=Pseudomonas sp. PDM22 TaxID=2769287 RepID=UPI00178590E8|nr:hypothetical protein [Pseudomonas sp. PDM22]MBD9517865.1 hypothetical protein [Pseudomonas sp. PDM22]